MSRIMIVDDEESILKSLQRLLRHVPCTYGNKTFPLVVSAFSKPEEAVEHARHESFDLFISDFRMPGMDGVEFLKAVKAIQPDAGRLILSGYADLNALLRAVNEVGIERFIGKPWNDYELISAIAQSLAHRELLLENRELANLGTGWLDHSRPGISEQTVSQAEQGKRHGHLCLGQTLRNRY